MALLKESDRISFMEDFQNFQMTIIAMVTLEPCNFMLGSPLNGKVEELPLGCLR